MLERDLYPLYTGKSQGGKRLLDFRMTSKYSYSGGNLWGEGGFEFKPLFEVSLFSFFDPRLARPATPFCCRLRPVRVYRSTSWGSAEAGNQAEACRVPVAPGVGQSGPSKRQSEAVGIS